MKKIKPWSNTEVNIPNMRCGLYLRYDANIDIELKNEIAKFCKWLRQNYDFPIRVPVYVKKAPALKCMDGDFALGTFLMPYLKTQEPYVRIATGTFLKDKKKRGASFAAYAVLFNIAHELTHYFQWLYDLDLTDIQAESQAKYYGEKIICLYLYHTC